MEDTRRVSQSELERNRNLTFFKSLPANAGPRAIITKYPEIYRPWSEMSQVLMNGPSDLSQAERELIFAYAAGVSESEFVYVAHSEVAYAWGVPAGLLDELIVDIDNPRLDPKLRPLLAFVRKLVLTPKELTQADADAVFEAGWDEKALHDAIAVTARAAFMQRITQGHGFTPMTREHAAESAKGRVELGYVRLFKEFRDDT
jgi:alkylhydroperoxidase family enzyme